MPRPSCPTEPAFVVAPALAGRASAAPVQRRARADACAACAVRRAQPRSAAGARPLRASRHSHRDLLGVEQRRQHPRHLQPQSAAHTPTPTSGPAPGPNTPPPRRGRAPRAPDYYANVGTVIEHLRADYPHLLEHEPDMSVFSDNIIFTERSSGYAVVGKHAYRNLLWAVRAQFKLFFVACSVAIHSLYHDDDAGIIYLRWRLQATPRVYGLMRHPPTIILDAMSVYKINETGFIAEHDLDNSAPVRPRLRPLVEDILSLGTIRVPGRAEPAGAGVGSCTGSATTLASQTPCASASQGSVARSAQQSSAASPCSATSQTTAQVFLTEC